MEKQVRYDELKIGDVIRFHGALERIKEITVKEAPANEWYPDECTVHFVLEPAEEESVRTLGSFYANGEYGGIGSLIANVVAV